MSLMFSCKEVSVLVSVALNHKLSWMEWLKIRFHLLFCRACRNFNRQMKILHLAVGRLAGNKNDNAGDIPTLSSEARERIKKTLHQCEHHDDKPKP